MYSRGQTYLTPEHRTLRYVPLITSPENRHREMLKHFTYLALADGEGILLRDFMSNTPEDFEFLYRRSDTPATTTSITLGYQNTTFMTPMTLADGSIETFMTTVYEIIGNATTPREASERLFDYQRRNWTHQLNDARGFAPLYQPYFTQNPYTPPPGYLTVVRQGDSIATLGFDTAAFRLLGIKTEHFVSPREAARTIAFELEWQWWYSDGNSVFDPRLELAPICAFYNTLEQVEDYEHSADDRIGNISMFTNCN